jgi:hypothetical protein
MATKESKHRINKLQEILLLCKDIGVDITEELPKRPDTIIDLDGNFYSINFKNLNKTQKVAKILLILKQELIAKRIAFTNEQIGVLQQKLNETSVHNLKVIRSRLIHLRKQTWYEMTNNSDSEFRMWIAPY